MISVTLTGPSNRALSSLSSCATFHGSDVDLSATASFGSPISINGLTLSFGEPSAFVMDFELPTKNMKFNIFNSGKLMEMPWRTTYTHDKGNNRTDLSGVLEIDSTNLLSAHYGFESRDYLLKYRYRNRSTTIEPSYDSSTNSWGFGISQMLNANDFVAASFHSSSSKILGLKWTRLTRNRGLEADFTISAAAGFGGESWIPKVKATSKVSLSM